MIVISPYAKRGYISHTYTDHVSILKFIERNWHLRPLSRRSLDNLPNPKTRHGNPYIPANRPAIGSMFDMFKFHRKRGQRRLKLTSGRDGVRVWSILRRLGSLESLSPPSTSGLGRGPFKAEARVRIPLGVFRFTIPCRKPHGSVFLQ